MFDFYPSELDIMFSERCIQDCDYCFVHKSCPATLTFPQVKEAVDIFSSFPTPTRRKAITFYSSDPLLYPELYKKTIRYIFSKFDDGEITVGTATNGIKLDGKMRQFVKNCCNEHRENYWLSVSIDGKRMSHDAHRRLRDHGDVSAFDLSWNNLLLLPKGIPHLLLLTVAPTELDRLQENVGFLLRHGFHKISICPQLFFYWDSSNLEKLRKTMRDFVVWADSQRVNMEDVMLLGRFFYRRRGQDKLLLGCDGHFYISEGALVFPYRQRRPYRIGSTRGGIDLTKRYALFHRLLDSISSNLKVFCRGCSYFGGCSYPMLYFLWCVSKGLDFPKHYKNYCQLVQIFADTAMMLHGKDGCNLGDCDLEKALCFGLKMPPVRCTSVVT